MACEEEHGEIVEALLKAGASIDLADDYGVTPLLSACEKGYIEIVTALLGAEADINKATNNHTSINTQVSDL